MSVMDIPIRTIDGEETTLAEHRGKVILVVNVASRCGYSPQYEKLEDLQERYGDRGFTVIGVPSNQFLQELGSAEAIKEYCTTTWGVTFPMMEKVRVNGRSAHPLFVELTKATDPDGKAGKVRWNFEKFLILPDGSVRRFRTAVEPDDRAIVDLIESWVEAAA